MELTHVVTIQIGQCTNIEFHSSILKTDDNHFSFIRIDNDESGKPVGECGLVLIDVIKRKAVYMNDSLQMTCDILTMKEVDGNYYFKCATDLFRVDIFACDQDLWIDKGESIFM